MNKIFIGTPSHDTWQADFGVSLANLVSYLSFNNKHAFSFGNSRGCMLCANRIHLADAAIEGGFTHLLFLDSDMSFPPDTLDRLIAHDKDIVAANYVMKEHPARPVSTGLDDMRCSSIIIDEKTFVATPKRGLESVKAVGFGCCLIRTNVIRSLPQPWFDMRWSDEYQAFQGEDASFCMNAIKRGFQVFIDHDLSQEITHHGRYGFSWKDC
jgi:hypothetical protein